MGISNLLRQYPSLWLSLTFILFLTNFSLLIASNGNTTSSSTTFDRQNNENNDVPSTSNPSNLLAPPPQPLYKSKETPFRPSIAVIVGVLTTIFSVTFLMLLYAKHCRRADTAFSNNYPHPVSGRKNSGIDRSVIESLPVFRFASLQGQKDGLECAVCLNKFEPTEVLRLLPKCRHAFHIECVDTWLDAHSTCPLCRYRVDPEDILLVEESRILNPNVVSKVPSMQHSPRELGTVSRISGRHSFAGNSLEVIVEKTNSDPTSFVPRRSLDSWSSRKKKNSEIVAVGVGCFDRPRKDGLLLADKTSESIGTGERSIAEHRRLEHRIIISGNTEFESTTDGPLPNHRWSDVQPSDLFVLRSEMILSDSYPVSMSTRGSRPSSVSRQAEGSGGGFDAGHNNASGGRNLINTRSVSEITGLSRFRSNEQEEEQRQQRQTEQRQRQLGAVSRWLAWISQQSQQQPPAHVPRTPSPSSAVV